MVASGVRWAERTWDSLGTPSSSSISAEWRIVSQSDLLPMTIATSALEDFDSGMAAVHQFPITGRIVKAFFCQAAGAPGFLPDFLSWKLALPSWNDQARAVYCAHRVYGYRKVGGGTCPRSENPAPAF